MLKVLVVDDEFSIRHMLKTVLTKAGYEVDLAEDGEIALEKVRGDIYDVVLCDIKMPKMDGFAFLEQINKEKINLTVIMMTSYGSIDTAVQAIRKGAYDYISKPFNSDEVIIAIKKAEEREKLLKENELLKRGTNENFLKDVIIESPAIKEVILAIEKIAPYRQPVLITGESGVGKEIVARLIHQKSNRANNPFVAINCSAIPENLLESELFGYAKGAFTDASQPKRGLFEYANGGVCFLDEISEMKEGLQSKLLRFLEDGEIRRVGDLKTIKVDVRIISATNKDLKKMIEEGRFRQDLFYRLNVIPIEVPPLRERKEDIEAYIKRELKRNGKYITDDAMEVLLSYKWPGNFREMKNFIEKTLIFSNSDKIDIEDLPDYMFEKRVDEKIEGADDVNIMSLKKAIEDMEKKFINRALQLTGGNRLKAAKLLEISPRSLHYKLKEYGIE
ncbi:MAG: sigma-54 dependent transcriptional regulator [Proteobacteria bacterium]|nr:sigma-54 dependent transcriptional regulator [Pseudomonadota bacterium]